MESFWKILSKELEWSDFSCTRCNLVALAQMNCRKAKMEAVRLIRRVLEQSSQEMLIMVLD